MTDLPEMQRTLGEVAKRAPRNTRWRHLKSGGEYLVTGHCYIEATARPGVLYTPLYGAQGFAWVRDAEQFLDGRFERLAAPSI